MPVVTKFVDKKTSANSCFLSEYEVDLLTILIHFYLLSFPFLFIVGYVECMNISNREDEQVPAAC